VAGGVYEVCSLAACGSGRVVVDQVIRRDRPLLRDVDHEDVRDADLGDVLAVENPAGRVRRGWVVLGLSRVVLRVSR
jgi:hypothetical protein